MVSASNPPGTLQFGCQPGCTKCCDTRGFVYLTEQDLKNAAEFLGISPSAFARRYVYRTRHLRRLRKPPDRQCPFLEPGVGCTIHSVKPTQCRLFPFWPELVESATNWHYASYKCPGIGKGELIQIGTAMEVAAEMKTAYPTQYS